MTMTTLKAQLRDKSQKIKSIIEDGNIPAVFYGPKEDATSIFISKKEFIKAFRDAGESTIVDIETPNGKKKSVLIHDVQFDPVITTPIHVDFYVVEAGKEVEVNVPLEFVGVSPAIKELGGSLVKVIHELAVKGKPADLPHSIEVDISVLDGLDSNISAGDINLPKGISISHSADDIVASISVAKEEEEEVAGEDIADIEVEKKGKKEGEEDSDNKSE